MHANNALMFYWQWVGFMGQGLMTCRFVQWFRTLGGKTDFHFVYTTRFLSGSPHAFRSVTDKSSAEIKSPVRRPYYLQSLLITSVALVLLFVAYLMY